ncbi:MAG: hypothetical protein ACREPW_07430 [Candidatus Binataceae bacterium]
MAGKAHKVQGLIGGIVRLVVSLILPIWGIALIVIGINYDSAWWIASGVAIGIAGAFTFIGSPLIRFGDDER